MFTEQQINELDNELKALKATYPVAGSSVVFVIAKSQEFSVMGGQVARFKFVPDYGHGAVSFTKLRAEVTYKGAPVFRESVQEPQDGSGDVILRVDMGADPNYEYKVVIFASGVSNGTFSLL